MQLQKKTIQQIERERLAELQKQQALYGPNTEPAILIEIQALEHKYKQRTQRTKQTATAEIDLLANLVASALKRITSLENSAKEDTEARQTRQAVTDARQRIIDIWLACNTMLLLVVLLLLALR